MNNQEKDHCLDRLMELDRKIADQVNFLFDHDSEIIAEQKENISNKAKLIFNRTSNLLEKHDETNHRTLNFKGDLVSIRFIKEERGNEITIRIQEFKNCHSTVVYLKKDDIIIRYGMEDFNQVSEVGGDKINHLVDLIEEKNYQKKYK